MRDAARTLVAARFALGLFAVLGVRASAQDLQPGRNFVSAAQFGTGRSADIDSGDVDGDGDLDVLVGNGMDGSAQANRIYINLGGLQGGTLGVFGDQTGTRLAGAILERTRDVSFADIDADGDLDFLDVTDGSLALGSVQRIYLNQGGLQLGTAGFFNESTATSWGTLASIPLAEQVLGGNQGPWRGWGWDGDFADLDLDGDLDLFWTTAGPSKNGMRDSLVFLNDGAGVLHELWPWADPAATTKMKGIDAALADLDGDFDLDIFIAGEGTPSRVFSGNTANPQGHALFQDVTATALDATGAAQIGTACYEVELLDADLDGDFDAWAVNWHTNLDRVLENVGTGPGAGLAFFKQTAWIAGDPNLDEQGADPIDYDGDGDLDVMMANFSGTNMLYRNTLAQGGAPSQGFVRTGSGGEPPETPSTNNGGRSLDVECVDVDGDGDDDICLANDADQQNFLFTNVLGVPDVHAPTFVQVESVADKAAGPPARVIAQVRDNHANYVFSRYPTFLVWSVDGGAETSEIMFAQGGGQYMGSIPGGAVGLVAYRVETTDAAGNTGVSATQSYLQGIPSPWSDLGFALAGAGGAPALAGNGSLVAGSPGTLVLSSAAPSAPAVLCIGFGAGAQPFKGGSFVPDPLAALHFETTSPAGAVELSWAAWPDDAPSGAELVFQYWIADAGGPAGFAASNAVKATMP